MNKGDVNKSAACDEWGEWLYSITALGATALALGHL